MQIHALTWALWVFGGGCFTLFLQRHLSYLQGDAGRLRLLAGALALFSIALLSTASVSPRSASDLIGGGSSGGGASGVAGGGGSGGVAAAAAAAAAPQAPADCRAQLAGFSISEGT